MLPANFAKSLESRNIFIKSNFEIFLVHLKKNIFPINFNSFPIRDLSNPRYANVKRISARSVLDL